MIAYDSPLALELDGTRINKEYPPHHSPLLVFEQQGGRVRNSTDCSEKAHPMLRDLQLAIRGKSRNLGKTFMQDSLQKGVAEIKLYKGLNSLYNLSKA